MDNSTQYETSSYLLLKQLLTTETISTAEENVYTTSSSTTVTQGPTETNNTTVLVTNSGTQRPYTESTGPLEDTGTTPEEPASDVALIVGAVVGVTVVLIIAAVVIVVVVCRCHKKKEVSEEERARKISTIRPPGLKTLTAREHHRPALDIGANNSHGDEEDNEDEDSGQRHSDITFEEIQAGIPVGTANTTETPRKSSIWKLPDISHWSSHKTKKSKKSSGPKISETVKESVEYDEATGLPIYPVEKPVQSSSSSPRKNSVQKMLGLRKDSYTLNPEERKGSLFQLPDLSGLVTKMKKKGKSKHKLQNPGYDIAEKEEREIGKNIINQTSDLPSEAVYNNFDENMDQLTRMPERQAPNPHASSSNAKGHTALQVGEPNTADEVTEAQITTQNCLAYGEDTGRYSVEYANTGPSSRPTTLTNETTMTESPEHLGHTEPKMYDISHKVEYMNLKAVGKSVSDSASGVGTEASGVTYQEDPTSHTSEIQTNEKRTSSIYANVPDVVVNDLFLPNDDGSISSPGHSGTYGSDSLPQDQVSVIVTNPLDSDDVRVHQENTLQVQKVAYPLGYTPSDIKRPSGPYVNVPETGKQVPDIEIMSNSHEDLFKRYS